METAPIITATLFAPDGKPLDVLSSVTHHLEIFVEVFSGVAGTLRLGLMVMITDADVAKIQHLAEVGTDVKELRGFDYHL
jgi:hypothetical protein